MSGKTLIFVPTFNERENVEKMARELMSLNVNADILFLDDNSPDGTGEILDRIAEANPCLKVIHRTGKQGIGTAHQAGIAWAYEHGYQTLITLDCDFTHSPADIPRLLEKSRDCDIALGSRYMERNSLPGWNLLRRTLTHMGHQLTRRLLRIRCDATGAFRVCRLDRIPRSLFAAVRAPGYAFFFESIFVLDRNGFAIGEVPIVLPSRTYGHSKMTAGEALRSAKQAFGLFVAELFEPQRFYTQPPAVRIEPGLDDPQQWESYWRPQSGMIAHAYGVVAFVYRNLINRRQLTSWIRANFSRGSRLLHAGCGSGQVDAALQHEMRLTALDICPAALELYRRGNPAAADITHGSILNLPFAAETFDGVYNMGVMEHFTSVQIVQIFKEFHRVLKPGGKIVIFWPMQNASSVRFLGWLQRWRERFGGNVAALHPPEISLLQDRAAAEQFLQEAGFDLTEFMPAHGIYVQAIIVGRRRDPAA